MNKNNIKAGDKFIITPDCIEDGMLDNVTNGAMKWLKKIIVLNSKCLAKHDIVIECYIDDHEVRHCAREEI